MGELCVELEDLYDGGVESDDDGVLSDEDGLVVVIVKRSSDDSVSGDGGDGGNFLGDSVGVLSNARILLDIPGDALTLSMFLGGILQRRG